MDIMSLFALSIKEKASDLHLASGLAPLLRVQGELIPIQGAKVCSTAGLRDAFYGLMTLSEQQYFEKNLELDFTINFQNQAFFRTNLFQQARGLAAAIRLVPKAIPTLEQLGLPKTIKQLLHLNQGLILITGATGSGKSTTGAAMIQAINQLKACHILTIEDPIEFIHSSQKGLVNQRQVKRDTQTFSSALQCALRQDPDVLFLGEMRDTETIRLALSAAETGHLVISTLHTASAPRAIHRVIDTFPSGEKAYARSMMAESLQAVISQKLVKTYLGERTAAFEIMLNTPAVRNLIKEDNIPQLYTVMQTSAHLGMCTLDQSLLALVKKQIISLATARDHAIHKTSFA